MGDQNFWNQNIFQSQIQNFSGPIIYWIQKFFGPKIFSNPKFFSDQKIFGLRIFPQIFWIKNFVFIRSFLFNLSYFLDQKFFWINFFFCNRSSSQTPGLPKLNTLDLSLVSLSLCAKFQTLSSILSGRFW